jgi:iron(III) transport system ATP-binding protein
MSAKCIRIKNLSKAFDSVHAVQNISFLFSEKENTAILGPSGCGKSTLLRMIAGLDTPSGGEVYLGDKLLSRREEILISPHHRGLAMVFQDLALWPAMSVLENVTLGLAGQGLSKSAMRDRAMESLKLCRIDGYQDRKPSQLSGGQQQRVALARALAVRPSFVLLDEPFSGLDLVTKMELLDEIKLLARNTGMAIILVTHDPLEARTLCSQLMVLEEGALVEQGTFAELMCAPKSRTMQVFTQHSGLAQFLSQER